MPRAMAALVIAIALLAGGCAASGPSPSATAAPSTAPSTSPAESAAPSGIDLSTIPTACFGLGADDCRRVVAQLSTILPAGSAVTYIQVGPFGCAAGQGCAPSLVERPQGDVTLEAGAGALSYHVTVTADGTLTVLDPDHATFTSRGGFTVQLQRHEGAKYLPLCQ